MKLLGIDYGRKKIGVAISEGQLVEPLMVLKIKSQKDILEKLCSLVKGKDVGKIVIGIPGGGMDKEIKEFGKLLQNESKTLVIFQDETLTTKDAQELSIKAGIKRLKRKEMEDAYSAALILQSYLGY